MYKQTVTIRLRIAHILKTSRRCVCTCKFNILQVACILPHNVLNSNNIHLSCNICTLLYISFTAGENKM